MTLTPELQAKIDAMTYMEMLKQWRFAPIGDEIMQGESGDYWAKRMFALRDADPLAAVHASKMITWEG